jgi:hypothetical protein
MADDNTRRSYRSNDPYRRSTEPPGGSNQPAGSDPLAELARLIGKSDPFADFGQGSQRRAEPPRAPSAAPPPASDWRKTVAAMPPFETLQSEPEPEEPAAPHYAAPHQDFDRRDAYPRAAADEPHGDAHADDARFHHRYVDEQQFAHAGHVQDHRDDARDARYAGEPQHAHAAPYYEEGAPVGPHDEEMYDDPPRSRGRNGIITAVTLVACAMIGTAGAYGYRTYVVSGTSKTPPVITAETTPNKVVASIDSQPTKSIQDRVREPGERVISREEQPVELKNPPATSAPRVVLPAPVAPSQFQTGAPMLPSTSGNAPPRNGGQQPAAAAPSSSTAAGSEPKRIRTVTIRPDGTDLSGRPVAGMAPATGQPATAPTRTGSIPKSGQPARSGGPMSLDPQASASTPPPPPPSSRDRAVAAPPPAAAVPAQNPAPPRLASVPANVGTGGYLVQLSSQKSEAEAQSSFRSLQAKFPDQLGSRSPIVRRADLGDKGIYYRAMVGPFGSADEAGRFCSGLKAAGGQCLIQKN